MARRASARKLLVEGDEDKRVVPQLIEANGIDWGESESDWIVDIAACDGFPNMVSSSLIETHLKASGLLALGLIADANGNGPDKFSAIRSHLVHAFPDFPRAPEPGGVVAENSFGLRAGIWLMPDNQSRGMMETFLTYLVPENNESILDFASDARDEAKRLGAPFRDAHADKAKIYTWLAWQDPPGRQLHDAVKQKILNPASPTTSAFVDWFKRLYQL